MIAAGVLFAVVLAVVLRSWCRLRAEVEWERERPDLEAWLERMKTTRPRAVVVSRRRLAS